MSEIGKTPVLFHYTNSLRRWLVCSAEIANFYMKTHKLTIKEPKNTTIHLFQHRKVFKKISNSYCQQKMRLRTLFSDNSYDFYALKEKCVVPQDVVSRAFSNLYERKQKQLIEFLKPRLWNRSKAMIL